MALPVDMSSGFGVLEYWSVGVLEILKTKDSTLKGFCITPLLHHSITPARSRRKKDC